MPEGGKNETISRAPMAGPFQAMIHPDITSILAGQAGRRPNGTAIEVPGQPGFFSYSDLFHAVVSISSSLRAAGVTRQDRVAISLPNGPDTSLALLGAASTATAAPLNPAYLERECAAHFTETKARFLVSQAGRETPATAAARKRGIPILELEMHMPGGARLASLPAPDAASSTVLAAPGDVALVLLTSGSTGRPKRVPLTHRNICVSVADVCRCLALTPEDRCLSMWEQFHIGGLVDLLLAPLAAGGTVISAGSFSPDRFYGLLEECRPTWFQGVPATLHELVATARSSNRTRIPSTLRLIRSVAAALPPRLMQDVEDLFGVPVIQTFGMTEAAPLITTNPLPPGIRKPGSAGPSVGPDVAIMDEAGNLLPPGQQGEIVIRGENIMSGYEADPEANAEAFRYGWFHTGDVGMIDGDGYLFLNGRIREMINRGGEKISPSEIETVLSEHPAIAQAVAFGVPHPVLGEDVAVAVVVREPGSLTENEVRQYTAERLVDFKVPRQVVFVDEIPRGPAGKVKRLGLSDALGLAAKTGDHVAPRNQDERRLSAIWARVLRLERVGIRDDFSSLGGDSLSGVRLLAAVEKEFGRALPLEALVVISTVEAMARTLLDEAPNMQPIGAPAVAAGVLSQSIYRSMLAAGAGGHIPRVHPESLVIAANTGGARPPLFWCFNSPEREMSGLLPHLAPDQPVYGMYSGGGRLDDSDDINGAIAHHYAQEVARIRPTGPLVLGGNCRGASVATRIVFMLGRQGRTVDRLCVLDHFDTRLFDYPGRLLLMFGKRSHFKAYRPLRWGLPGWRKPFRSPPEVSWVPGAHGHFFGPQNVKEVALRLSRFLAGVAAPTSVSSTLDTHAWLWLHRVPGSLTILRRMRRALRPASRARGASRREL